ncbi:TetR/AcrR family transcriptional regulator [Kribbella sp. NPDC051620]|uniref:TetR/AcrR family transcriptional regulator n=1 Tax=Kribbella sp. NPDC051620 TaxID=3364120 RepID=UPI0037BD48C5
MANVKSSRPYDTSGRRARAHRNREGILNAAERRFTATGYGATTVAAVAADAGVSVETVYKAFGSKSGLVRALYDRGLAGRSPVPAYERSDEMREHEPHPATIMRNWGVLTSEVGSVVTPIRLLMRTAAATDPEMAALVRDIDAERLDRMRHHATFLADRGQLRDGVTVDDATDVFWTCSSAELYDLLVLQRGWPAERFARFVGDTMIAALLPNAAE